MGINPLLHWVKVDGTFFLVDKGMIKPKGSCAICQPLLMSTETLVPKVHQQTLGHFFSELHDSKTFHDGPLPGAVPFPIWVCVCVCVCQNSNLDPKIVVLLFAYQKFLPKRATLRNKTHTHVQTGRF